MGKTREYIDRGILKVFAIQRDNWPERNPDTYGFFLSEKKAHKICDELNGNNPKYISRYPGDAFEPWYVTEIDVDITSDNTEDYEGSEENFDYCEDCGKFADLMFNEYDGLYYCEDCIYGHTCN